MNADSGFQLADLAGVVRRRGKLVAGAVLGVILAAYWVAMALPNEYESYATVLVEPQSVAPELVRAGVPSSDLNQRLHLMTAEILSRPRLSRMIDDLNLYQEESRYLLREEIIDEMRDAIRVEPVIPELESGARMRARELEINQFRIFFRHRKASKARSAAQALANDFIREHIDVRVEKSQKSLEFIEAELERLASQIQGVEEQISDVKERNSGRLPEDMVANQNRLSRLTVDLADARRRQALARSDETFYRSQALTAGEIARGGDVGDPVQRKKVLEVNLAAYLARGWTEKHPDIIATRQELKVLEEQIAARADKAEAGGGPTNFAQQSADAGAHRAALQAEHGREEISQVEAAIAEVQERLAQTPAVAQELDALEREYQHLFGSYQDFSNRRLEAGVQADLERRQLGEQFRVLEAAFVAPDPVSPNRPLIVVLGAILGLGLGGALGILFEALDPSLHEARQAQSALQLPVLASIPQIWLESDRLRQRRARLATAFATLGLTAFALAGGWVSYVWMNGAQDEAAAEAVVEPRGGEPVDAASAR